MPMTYRPFAEIKNEFAVEKRAYLSLKKAGSLDELPEDRRNEWKCVEAVITQLESSQQYKTMDAKARVVTAFLMLLSDQMVSSVWSASSTSSFKAFHRIANLSDENCPALKEKLMLQKSVKGFLENEVMDYGKDQFRDTAFTKAFKPEFLVDLLNKSDEALIVMTREDRKNSVKAAYQTIKPTAPSGWFGSSMFGSSAVKPAVNTQAEEKQPDSNTTSAAHGQ